MERQYSHYYMAENRTYGGYDRTLQTGPYNFGWGFTEPNRVEHFPYQDGLLIWYWDTQYGDNNTSAHMGGGEALPIDARAASLKWSDGAVVRNRIQTFDATFGTEATDDTWRQWALQWDATPGSHRLVVRATDKAGRTQTATRRPVSWPRSSLWNIARRRYFTVAVVPVGEGR